MAAQGTQARRPESVALYFTYASPFSYLAWHRITKLRPQAYARLDIQWTPVVFRRMMALSGGEAGGSPPLQLEYNYADAQRWADAYGAPFAAPHRHHPADQTAHRIHLLAQDAGRDVEARWMAALHAHVRGTQAHAPGDRTTRGHDPSDHAAVLALAAKFGIPKADELAREAETPAGRAAAAADGLVWGALDAGAAPLHAALDARLEANTQQALREGCCGVPFVRWNGQAYWGNDRLAWLEAALAGREAPPL